MPVIPLPIDSLLPEICEAVSQGPAVVIQASAGSGKTTRVPPALLSLFSGRILVLEPRRIAARLAAERVASERGERCGDIVGYQVRQDDRSGPSTRLKFITEGLLPKYMLSNPALRGIDCVVLDEFHERSLHTDAALALVRLLQGSLRPDLRLVIMSATLDEESLSKRFQDAIIFRNEGRLHPLEIEYLPRRDDRPLKTLVSGAVREIVADSRYPGHILIFLPGASEIYASMEALRHSAGEWGASLLELRSEIPYEEQAKAFAPSSARKIICSTNVAETSVTIEGVTAVVDSGLARIAGFAHWSGLPTLDVRPVCRASCAQRAGRAGRTSPGIVKRLYTEWDFNKRPAFEEPEIVRCDLTQVLLDIDIVLRSLDMGSVHVRDIPWLENLPAAMVAGGEDLLRILGALDIEGGVTEAGRRMASFPFHPRLARMIVEGESLHCASQALLAAMLVSEGMLLRRGQGAPDYGESDIGWQRDIFIALAQSKKLPHHISQLIDSRKIARLLHLLKSLCASSGFSFRESMGPLSEDALAQVVYAGFPDRICQVRQGDRGPMRRGDRRGALELNFCGGGGGILSPSSVVQDSPLLVAVDAGEKTLDARASQAIEVRLAQAVSPELLMVAGNAFIREESCCVWDGKAERVRAVKRVLYGALVLEERAPAIDERSCEEVLREALKEKWPYPFPDDAPLTSYAERCAVIRSLKGDYVFPDLSHDDFDMLLSTICRGKRSFQEIASRSLDGYIDDMLSREAAEALRRLAPSMIHIGCNRKAQVHYEPGKTPWVASRLQDFFGTTETPKIGGGKIPLVIHLRAPNGQAVQVTGDLEGFWERVYPSVRKELSRRYPRHYWPEDPAEAAPRAPGKRRQNA
jgi:ATP-dependent helicase HrpB